MHELGIVFHTIRTIEEVAAEQGLTRVGSVTLELGEVSGAIPQELVGAGTPQQGAFRELNTADFLSREEVTLDTEKISGYLTGKTVLVTGGGGSIGSELCRQVMRFKPAKLLIFDIYENCAYELLMELQQKYGRDVPVTVLVGSIRDKARLDEVFETYHPTVVFHAAAHKHVPLMEKAATGTCGAYKNIW